MGLKSAYRKSIPETPPPASEKFNAEPAAEAIASNPAVAIAEEVQTKADEATARLRQQLTDIKRAEMLQAQALMQQRPMNHTEKLAAWRAAGMSDADHNFLASNPDMVQHDRLTAVAAHEA